MLGTRTIVQPLPIGPDEDGITVVRAGYPGSQQSGIPWANFLLDNVIERGAMDFRNCYSNIDVAGSNPANLTRSAAIEDAAEARGETIYAQVHVNGDTTGAGGTPHNIIYAPDPADGQPAFNNLAGLPQSGGVPRFWSVAPSLGNGDAAGYQGTIDAGLIALGNSLKARSVPVLFCFQHEPGDDYTGNGYTGSTFRNAGMANWARAFNHIVDLWTTNIGAPGSAGFPNLLGYMPTFTQINMRTLSGGQTATGGQPTYKDPNNHWRLWYDQLDFKSMIYAIGCDYYVTGSDAWSTFEGLGTYNSSSNTTRGAAFVADEVKRLATVAPTSEVKPLIFGELGYSPCDGRKDGSVMHRKADYLRGIADYLRNTWHGQQSGIIGLCFQANLPPANSGAGFWDYDPADDADARAAMQELWNDPLFGGTGPVAALPIQVPATGRVRGMVGAVS
jgi:hypothetical protein